MDRRARKIEQKRKQRELAKKQERVGKSRRPDENLVKLAAGAPFGACYLSAGWDDEKEPALVTAVVTRTLAGGRIVAGVALVDRTCLGIKDGYVADPMRSTELERFVTGLGLSHGGIEICEPRAVLSLVFHALDYAATLGFKPHRDFPAALFGPRPDTLEATAWSKPAKPLFIAGPEDDTAAILKQLTSAVGEGKFDYVAAAEAV